MMIFSFIILKFMHGLLEMPVNPQHKNAFSESLPFIHIQLIKVVKTVFEYEATPCKTLAHSFKFRNNKNLW